MCTKPRILQIDWLTDSHVSLSTTYVLIVNTQIGKFENSKIRGFKIPNV